MEPLTIVRQLQEKLRDNGAKLAPPQLKGDLRRFLPGNEANCSLLQRVKDFKNEAQQVEEYGKHTNGNSSIVNFCPECSCVSCSSVANGADRLNSNFKAIIHQFEKFQEDQRQLFITMMSANLSLLDTSCNDVCFGQSVTTMANLDQNNLKETPGCSRDEKDASRLKECQVVLVDCLARSLEKESFLSNLGLTRVSKNASKPVYGHRPTRLRRKTTPYWFTKRENVQKSCEGKNSKKVVRRSGRLQKKKCLDQAAFKKFK